MTIWEHYSGATRLKYLSLVAAAALALNTPAALIVVNRLESRMPYQRIPSGQGEAGERFPKFGVGLLREPDEEPYVFHRSYDCEPFDVAFTGEADHVRFVTSPKACSGYALRQEKSITVCDNVLQAGYLFENAGDKELALTEYCHNFLTLDGEKTGPMVHLELPTAAPRQGKAGRRENSTMRGTEYGFGFTGEGTAASRIAVAGEEIDRSRDFTWKLRSDTTGLYVAGAVSFAPAQVVVWSIGEIVSPEVMHHFTLAPGECVSYTRQWTFGRA